MMYKNILFLLGLALVLMSCSSDKDESDLNNDPNTIVGIWSLTDLNVGDANSSEIAQAEDILDVLIAQDCEILTFDFKQDNTVTAVAKDFSETGRDVNASGTGLLIECPEESETSSSVWSLEGNQLTFINEDQTEETITIELNGNTLIIPAEVIDEDNLGGATAIFTRQ